MISEYLYQDSDRKALISNVCLSCDILADVNCRHTMNGRTVAPMR